MYRAKDLLELAHGDLCGPITPTTPGGSSYFLLIVDDCSRYMWLRLIKSKDQALGAFKIIKTRSDIECQGKLKTFKTDRGGEFNSKEFVDYCEEWGVKKLLIAPYSPQQNGVVERRNQTIVEMARSLLKSTNIPTRFCGEAVVTAVYLLNCSTTKGLFGKTPYEAWYDKKPSVHHFRTFGCVAHVKTVKPHTKRLDDRSIPMVFIGYEPGTKAYRCYDPKTDRLHVSRDVVFEEGRCWDWSAECMQEEASKSKESTFNICYEVETDENANINPEASMAGEEGSKPQHPHIDGSSTSMSEVTTVLEFLGSEGIDVDSLDALDVNSSSDGTLHFRAPRDIYEATEPLEVQYSGLCLLPLEEPMSYEMVAKEECWKIAMEEEMKAIQDNGTWNIMELPNDRKPIGLKWVFKVK